EGDRGGADVDPPVHAPDARGDGPDVGAAPAPDLVRAPVARLGDQQVPLEARGGGEVVADRAQEAVQVRVGVLDQLEVAAGEPGGDVGRGDGGQAALVLGRPLGHVGGQSGGRLEPQPGG